MPRRRGAERDAVQRVGRGYADVFGVGGETLPRGHSGEQRWAGRCVGWDTLTDVCVGGTTLPRRHSGKKRWTL